MTDLADILIEQSEGCQLEAYKDTLGLWTIGWGHLLQPQGIDWTGSTIDQAQADQWLDEDTAQARVLAAQFPNFAGMSDVRQAVLISMTFQMGGKPLTWPNFMAALKDTDYTAAAAAGRDTDWWRDETHARAEREMSMLESDEWIGARA